MNKNEVKNKEKPMLRALLMLVIITGIAAWCLLFALPVFFYAIPDRPSTINTEQSQQTATHFLYSSAGKKQ